MRENFNDDDLDEEPLSDKEWDEMCSDFDAKYDSEAAGIFRKESSSEDSENDDYELKGNKKTIYWFLY